MLSLHALALYFTSFVVNTNPCSCYMYGEMHNRHCLFIFVPATLIPLTYCGLFWLAFRMLLYNIASVCCNTYMYTQMRNAINENAIMRRKENYFGKLTTTYNQCKLHVADFLTQTNRQYMHTRRPLILCIAQCG